MERILNTIEHDGFYTLINIKTLRKLLKTSVKTEVINL